MILKDNFNKKEISNAFQILRGRLNTDGLSDKMKVCLDREKRIWAELGYEEKLAHMVDAWDRVNTRKALAIGGSLAAAAMIAFTIQVATQPNAYLLEIGGAQVGYVESPEVVDEAVAGLRGELKEQLGDAEVIIDEDAIASIATREKKADLLDSEAVEDLILDQNICKLNAWAIQVDGKNIVSAVSQDSANKILADIKENYKSDGAEIIGFSYKENVSVQPVVIGLKDIMEEDEAVKYILTGSKEPQTYTVQSGDTLWDIAVANGMKPAELAAVNPDFEPDRLKIGQVLNLVAVKPYLTVSITERVASKQIIPFATQYEKSSSLTRGQTKVKSPGQNGQKEVVSEVVKENGRVVAAKVISETVVSEPVVQVAYQGTKPIVLTAGSGVLGNPLSSIVPSKNGGMFGASRGGRRHAGVDLRSPKGSPIYAADSGTVVRVTNKGSYGKMIAISHGGGVETRYAHCDTMSVSVGDKVKKGQKIGTVGRTGNATGYLLHFEVRINGTAVNPMNYL